MLIPLEFLSLLAVPRDVHGLVFDDSVAIVFNAMGALVPIFLGVNLLP